MPSPMADILLHREVCRLRVAREESRQRPGSRRRLKLWNVSVQCTTALLLLQWTRQPSKTSAGFEASTFKTP